MIIREKLQDLSLSILAAIIAAIVLAFPVDTAAQGVAIDGTSATSQNLRVVWTAGDPEKIVGVYWNPNGLTGSEPNLTFSHSTADPCADGLLQYFGNSWAPPDPQSGGKVLVGAGSNGVRMKGPDSKVIINSTSTGCAPLI